LQYNFHPQCFTCPAQIKCIAKLSQLQYCHPETIQLALPGANKGIPVRRVPFINTCCILC
jgi:hypothetical protein